MELSSCSQNPHLYLLSQSAYCIFGGSKSFPAKSDQFGGPFNFGTQFINAHGTALKVVYNFLKFSPGRLIRWFFWLLFFHVFGFFIRVWQGSFRLFFKPDFLVVACVAIIIDKDLFSGWYVLYTVKVNGLCFKVHSVFRIGLVRVIV